MDLGFSDASTILVCPSISFPSVELRKITGIQHYEERMLFMILALDDPATRLVYPTSLPVDPAIVDYYLSFTRDPHDAAERIDLLPIDDAEPRALSAKLLERPDALDSLRALVGDADRAFLLPFNVSSWEAELCELLGLRLYGPAASLSPLGSKSGARRLARAAGVDVLDGAEDLWSVEEVEKAVATLLDLRPDASAIVIKLNNGFSGQGNAIIDVEGLRRPLTDSRTVFCAEEESWDTFARKIASGGAVVEELIRSTCIASPSVQMRVLPSGDFEVVSTHDQILGGPDDQVYLGCRFPARREYRDMIREQALRIGKALAERQVVGPFGIDFLVAEERDELRAYMSEINLRMGGTTHPFDMMRLATRGRYDDATGELLSSGSTKCYVATDNLKSPLYIGLSPGRVIEAVRSAGISFDRSTATGVTLHLLGSLDSFGKMGATCIADSHAEADELLAALRRTLDSLARGDPDPRA